MRPYLFIAAAAAVLGLAGCETDTARRQGRTPARYDDTTVRPSGEVRPNDGSPMRGDELYPETSPSGGTGTGTGVGESGASQSGSQIDRSSSTTTESPDVERSMTPNREERQGRRGGSTLRPSPRTGAPPSSDPLGNTTEDHGTSGTPP